MRVFLISATAKVSAQGETIHQKILQKTSGAEWVKTTFCQPIIWTAGPHLKTRKSVAQNLNHWFQILSRRILSSQTFTKPNRTNSNFPGSHRILCQITITTRQLRLQPKPKTTLWTSWLLKEAIIKILTCRLWIKLSYLTGKGSK